MPEHHWIAGSWLIDILSMMDIIKTLLRRTIFTEKSILDFWQDSKYVSGGHQFWSKWSLKHIITLYKCHFSEAATRGVLRNFAKFAGKFLCQSFFLIKLQARPATLLKKKLWHRCFPVNFAKFLRKSFFTEHLRWLLLQVYLPSLSYQCHETVQRESPVRSGQTPNCTLQ